MNIDTLKLISNCHTKLTAVCSVTNVNGPEGGPAHNSTVLELFRVALAKLYSISGISEVSKSLYKPFT